MNMRSVLASALCALVLTITACTETSTDRSTGQSIDDSVILAKAKTALIENSDTKAYDIDLEVYKGVVQLNGFVSSADEKQSAAATVLKVDGVTSVRNNLQVRPQDRGVGTVVDDSVITAKVKAALVADARTNAFQIEVTTNNGEVQLGGFVDSSAAKGAAENVAGSVAGVKSVRNALAVRN
jgi:hyperosmotically inducible periplasmic protein